MTRFDEPADLPTWSQIFPERAGARSVDRRDAPVWARAWNRWIGGKDHYPADAVSEHIGEDDMVLLARHVRYFRARAVRHLAADLGIRQFIELGAELPAVVDGVDHTRRVAHAVDPECRVVYVEDDRWVRLAAECGAAYDPAAPVVYAEADPNDPAEVLSHAAELIDLTQPVGLILINRLDFLPAPQAAQDLIADLVAPLAPDSHVVISHISYTDDTSDLGLPWYEHWNRAAPDQRITPRTCDEITALFFHGLELLEPGVVPVSLWRPDHSPFPPACVPALGGVARKVSLPTRPPPPRLAVAAASP